MSKLIFGCGYLGRRVAEKWQKNEETVHVVTRSKQRAKEFHADRLQPIVADITDPDSIPKLPDANKVLFSVGFDRSGDKSIHQVYVDGLKNVLERMPDSVTRFVYISSTGVYGQTSGELVDEDSDCQPAREGGRACLAAEQLIAGHPLGRIANILRLAGIYGPGRVPRRADLESGQPIAAPSSGLLNLIHVEDAVDIVLKTFDSAPTPRTYLVSDGHAVARRDYYRELARLLQLCEPRFAEPQQTAPAAQRATSDKQINNRRLLDELDVKLNYPSYREGLAAIIADEENNLHR